jgi:hypothetical protein
VDPVTYSQIDTTEVITACVRNTRYIPLYGVQTKNKMIRFSISMSLEMFLSIQDTRFCVAWEHSILNIMPDPGALERCIVQFGGLHYSLLRIKNNTLIILMFHRVLHTTRIFQKISYTLWNMSLILSHPPSLLGQCPKFDRIFCC